MCGRSQMSQTFRRGPLIWWGKATTAHLAAKPRLFLRVSPSSRRLVSSFRALACCSSLPPFCSTASSIPTFTSSLLRWNETASGHLQTTSRRSRRLSFLNRYLRVLVFLSSRSCFAQQWAFRLRLFSSAIHFLPGGCLRHSQRCRSSFLRWLAQLHLSSCAASQAFSPVWPSQFFISSSRHGRCVAGQPCCSFTLTQCTPSSTF